MEPSVAADNEEIKLKTKIIKGMYINLLDLLHCDCYNILESGLLFNTTGSHISCIDNFLTWLKAWTIYEYVLVNTYPSLYFTLTNYRQFIQQCDKKFKWNTVATYDRLFRCKLGQCGNFNFEKIGIMLYTQTFNVSTVKSFTKQCFRCNHSTMK